MVWSLGRDPRGTLWATTQAGISRFLADRHRWQAWKHPLLGTGQILALLPGRDGTWWIGQAPGGVFHMDPLTGKAERYDAESGLSNDWVYSLATDAEGRIWVGTGAGLYVGNRRGAGWRFEQVPRPGESTKLVLAILADSTGRLWVSTSAGLSLLENGRWRHFTTADGLLHDGVSYLTEGSRPFGLGRISRPGRASAVWSSTAPASMPAISVPRTGCRWPRPIF